MAPTASSAYTSYTTTALLASPSTSTIIPESAVTFSQERNFGRQMTDSSTNAESTSECAQSRATQRKTSSELGMTVPSLTQRQSKKRRKRTPLKDFRIRQMRPTRDGGVPEWKRKINLDGQPSYYRCESIQVTGGESGDDWQESEINPKYSTELTFITDINLLDEGYLEKINGHVRNLTEIASRHGELATKHVFVVFAIVISSWCYYMVDDHDKFIFWLEDYDIKWMTDQISGVEDMSSLDQWFMYEYWLFKELFPHISGVSEEDISDLTIILSRDSVERVTAAEPMVLYSREDSQELTRAVTSLKENWGSTYVSDEKRADYQCILTWTVARVMKNTAYDRFHRLHGHRNSFPTSGSSIFKAAGTEIMDLVMTLLFLNEFQRCREKVEKIWTGNIPVNVTIHEMLWNQFIEQLCGEYYNSQNTAAGIVAVNLALLAFLQNNNTENGLNSVQVLSVLSLIVGFLSISLSLYMRRQYHDRESRAAATSVFKKYPRFFAENMLAVHFCLPFSLLMWGILLFLASLAVLCIGFTTSWVQSTFIGIWITLAVLVAWSITLSQPEIRPGNSLRETRSDFYRETTQQHSENFMSEAGQGDFENDIDGESSQKTLDATSASANIVQSFMMV